MSTTVPKIITSGIPFNPQLEIIAVAELVLLVVVVVSPLHPTPLLIPLKLPAQTVLLFELDAQLEH